MRISDWSSDVCSSDVARQENETLDRTPSNAVSVLATDVLVSFEARGRDFGLSVPDDDEAEAEQILRLPNPPVAPKGRWVRNVQGAFSMLDHFARMGTARALQIGRAHD